MGAPHKYPDESVGAARQKLRTPAGSAPQRAGYGGGSRRTPCALPPPSCARVQIRTGQGGQECEGRHESPLGRSRRGSILLLSEGSAKSWAGHASREEHESLANSCSSHRCGMEPMTLHTSFGDARGVGILGSPCPGHGSPRGLPGPNCRAGFGMQCGLGTVGSVLL